jgi:hypothetical protein
MHLRIVGGYEFYPLTSPFSDVVAGEQASLHHLVLHLIYFLFIVYY